MLCPERTCFALHARRTSAYSSGLQKHAASSRPGLDAAYPEYMYYSDTLATVRVPVTVRAAAHCRSRRRRATPHPTSTTSRARARGHQRLYIPWKVVKPHEFSVARNYLQYLMRLNILNTAPASYHDFAHCRILLHSPDSNSKSRQKTHDTYFKVLWPYNHYGKAVARTLR